MTHINTSILLLVAVILSLVAGILLFNLFTKWRMRVKMTRRVHRAALGEKKAREYLLRNGFEIAGEQVTINPEMIIDGETVRFILRADFLVRKHGISAVVDAKSGSKAADPKNPETRRRMFEYLYYYNVDEVYVYDDVKKMLRKVEFSLQKGKQINLRVVLLALLTGLIAGGVIVYGNFIYWCR